MDGSSRQHIDLTREQIAHREVGHTTVAPGTARSLVILFLVFVCVLPLFELTRVAQRDEAALEPWRHLAGVPDAIRRVPGGLSAWGWLVASNRATLNGLHAFENALEDRSRVGQLLRPPAQAALSGPLGAGNEQVYIGRDGWLFYRTDVDYVLGRGFLDPDVLERRVRLADEWSEPPQPDPRRAIVDFKADLDARGIRLLVVPVPVKPAVHPEKLARADPQRGARVDNPDYERFIAALQDAGVEIFDTSALLRTAAGGGSATQYLATDTHWRPEAMELVAVELANRVRDLVALAPAGDPGYRVQPSDVAHLGDTFVMLNLPERQALFPPEPITLRRIVQADGSAWRSDRSSDVLLLGDSFANIFSLETMGWGSSAGLGEQLSFALGRPIDRIVQNADGAYATREALQREPERLEGKKIVIWQFATRELAFGDWRIY